MAEYVPTAEVRERMSNYILLYTYMQLLTRP